MTRLEWEPCNLKDYIAFRLTLTFGRNLISEKPATILCRQKLWKMEILILMSDIWEKLNIFWTDKKSKWSHFTLCCSKPIWSISRFTQIYSLHISIQQGLSFSQLSPKTDVKYVILAINQLIGYTFDMKFQIKEQFNQFLFLINFSICHGKIYMRLLNLEMFVIFLPRPT